MAPLAVVRAGEGPVVVLVHGFTQTASSMAPLASRLAAARSVVAVDLPGHGGSTEVSADLEETGALVADAVGDGKFDLVGYSLGGRVALHAVCAAVPGLRRVVAISASPGIVDPEARARRLERDHAMADALEADGDVDGFLHRWLANPMFATLPLDRADVEGRRSNTASGLADSLRRCSVGTQRWLGDELARAATPMLVLSGSRDDPFVRSAGFLAASRRSIAASVVPGAGHAAHLERPDVVARFVGAFLDAP